MIRCLQYQELVHARGRGPASNITQSSEARPLYQICHIPVLLHYQPMSCKAPHDPPSTEQPRWTHIFAILRIHIHLQFLYTRGQSFTLCLCTISPGQQTNRHVQHSTTLPEIKKHKVPRRLHQPCSHAPSTYKTLLPWPLYQHPAHPTPHALCH